MKITWLVAGIALLVLVLGVAGKPCPKCGDSCSCTGNGLLKNRSNNPNFGRSIVVKPVYGSEAEYDYSPNSNVIRMLTGRKCAPKSRPAVAVPASSPVYYAPISTSYDAVEDASSASGNSPSESIVPISSVAYGTGYPGAGATSSSPTAACGSSYMPGNHYPAGHAYPGYSYGLSYTPNSALSYAPASQLQYVQSPYAGSTVPGYSSPFVYGPSSAASPLPVPVQAPPTIAVSNPVYVSQPAGSSANSLFSPSSLANAQGASLFLPRSSSASNYVLQPQYHQPTAAHIVQGSTGNACNEYSNAGGASPSSFAATVRAGDSYGNGVPDSSSSSLSSIANRQYDDVTDEGYRSSQPLEQPRPQPIQLADPVSVFLAQKCNAQASRANNYVAEDKVAYGPNQQPAEASYPKKEIASVQEEKLFKGPVDKPIMESRQQGQWQRPQQKQQQQQQQQSYQRCIIYYDPKDCAANEDFQDRRNFEDIEQEKAIDRPNTPPPSYSDLGYKPISPSTNYPGVIPQRRPQASRPNYQPAFNNNNNNDNNNKDKDKNNDSPKSTNVSDKTSKSDENFEQCASSTSGTSNPTSGIKSGNENSSSSKVGETCKCDDNGNGSSSRNGKRESSVTTSKSRKSKTRRL